VRGKILGVFLAVVLAMTFLVGACAAPEPEAPAPEAPAPEAPAPAPEKLAPWDKAPSDLVVGYTPLSDPVDESRVLFDEGIRQGVEAVGGVTIYCSPSPRGGAVGDPAVQAACIDTFIAAGVDAVVIFPCEAEAIVTSVKKCNDAGIAVFMFGGFIDEGVADVVLSQASGDRVGGTANGEAMVAALTAKNGEPKGLVLEVQGSMKTSAGVDRSGGFHDIVDQYPDIEVVSKDGGWDMGEGSVIIEDWLTVHPETDAMYFGSAACYGIPSIPILDNLEMWHKVGEEGHVILMGNDPAGPMLYAMKHGYVDHIYDLGWQFGATALAKGMMQYLTTGIAPKVGDTMPVGEEGFADISIVKWTEYSGLIVLSGGCSVTPELSNWDLPALYGNGFMAPPNGISPETGAGLWTGD